MGALSCVVLFSVSGIMQHTMNLNLGHSAFPALTVFVASGAAVFMARHINLPWASLMNGRWVAAATLCSWALWWILVGFRGQLELVTAIAWHFVLARVLSTHLNVQYLREPVERPPRRDSGDQDIESSESPEQAYGNASFRHVGHANGHGPSVGMDSSAQHNATDGHDHGSSSHFQASGLGMDGCLAFASYNLLTQLLHVRFFSPSFILLVAAPYVFMMFFRSLVGASDTTEPSFPLALNFLTVPLLARLPQSPLTLAVLDAQTFLFAIVYTAIGVYAMLCLQSYFSHHGGAAGARVPYDLLRYTFGMSAMILVFHPDRFWFLHWVIQRFFEERDDKGAFLADDPVTFVDHMWYWRKENMEESMQSIGFPLMPIVGHVLLSAVLLLINQAAFVWTFVLSAQKPRLLSCLLFFVPSICLMASGWSSVQFWDHGFRYESVGYAAGLTLVIPWAMQRLPYYVPQLMSHPLMLLRLPVVLRDKLAAKFIQLHNKHSMWTAFAIVTATLVVFDSPYLAFTPQSSPDHARSTVESVLLWTAGRNSYLADTAKVPIPNVVHFSWPGGKREFEFVHHLVVRAAFVNLQPDEIIIHYSGEEPTDDWWLRSKPMFTAKPYREVYSFFGRPVIKPAHKADVQRMEVLLLYGGIYFDTDVFAMGPMGDLMNNDFVIGHESDRGLCNAIMLARPNARFLREWYKTSRTSFLPDCWDCQSVIAPYLLSEQIPDALKTVPKSTFFTYAPNIKGLFDLFVRKLELPPDDQDALTKDPRRFIPACREKGSCLAVHLWMTLAFKKNIGLKKISPSSMNSKAHTAFSLMAHSIYRQPAPMAEPAEHRTIRFEHSTAGLHMTPPPVVIITGSNGGSPPQNGSKVRE